MDEAEEEEEEAPPHRHLRKSSKKKITPNIAKHTKDHKNIPLTLVTAMMLSKGSVKSAVLFITGAR